jgi:flavin-dependent dehydrogenase
MGLIEMRVGIVGAGPAGSLCASQLSQAGAKVLLFDHRGAWEKPCGGGVTRKALDRYLPFQESLHSGREVRYLRVFSPEDQSVVVPFSAPLRIYSRQMLNRVLLDSACNQGVEFRQEKVLGFEREGSCWLLKTEKSSYRTDFLIGADGVNSFVRKQLVGPFSAEDLMMTFGVRETAPGDDTVEIKFYRDFPGYLWVFPRPEHLSIGICGRLKRVGTQTLKQRLESYRSARERAERPSGLGAQQSIPDVYGALVPSLQSRTLQQNNVSGSGWALVGDAAGFVDPITFEGIYFALRSGELLARSLAKGRPDQYPEACKGDFVDDFVCAAELFESFYTGRFLGSTFINRMVRVASRSPALCEIMDDFVAGKQNYRSLRSTLLRKSGKVFLQVVISSLMKSRDAVTKRGAPDDQG